MVLTMPPGNEPRGCDTASPPPLHGETYVWLVDLPSLRCLAVSEAALRHYGYSEAQFLTLKPNDLHPKEEATVLAHLLTSDPAAISGRRWHHRKQRGELVEVTMRCEPMQFDNRRAMLITVRDETEQQARAAERPRQGSLRQLFEAVPVPLIEQDIGPLLAMIDTLKAQGINDFRSYLAAHPDWVRQAMQAVTLIDANDAALHLLEAETPEALVGSADRLFGPDSEAAFRELLLALCESTRRFTSETVLQTLSGKPLHVQFAVNLPAEPHASPCLLVSLIDITLHKHLEAERVARLWQESNARRQAERASRKKDEFLATLSHELRTPLNAILGWTQTLRRTHADHPGLGRPLSAIESSARTQAKLINDLLYVADIAAGRLRLNIQTTDLTPLLQEAANSLRPALEAKGIHFELQSDASLPPVPVDATRVQQVVWNLMSNAVKFTPAGGRIRLALAGTPADHPTHVDITVQDSGEGISPQFLPYVFDRFRQGDSSSTRRHGGLGLGLAIVRHLVELHGGTVQAYSEGEGRGAAFVVRLPIQPPPGAVMPLPAAPVRTSPSIEPTQPGPLTGLRVLFVDDDANTREMLEEALRSAGSDVQTAVSVDDALAHLQRWRPHVLLSDIGMPDQDGYALIRQVRALADEAGGHTPAVALTGYARDRDREAILTAGYQAYCAKPVDLDTLFRVLLSSASGANAV